MQNDFVRMDWTEFERGWGQRPDGTSFHSSREEFSSFLKDFLEKEAQRNPGGVPDEYSRPSWGTPKSTLVSEEFAALLRKKRSIWLSPYCFEKKPDDSFELKGSLLIGEAKAAQAEEEGATLAAEALAGEAKRKERKI